MSYPRTSRVRRALQERSSAHNNERSPNRSLRMVSDQEDVDMYTTTPFPTKPEQILLPMPGKGQQEYISDTGFSYSDHHLGPSTSAYSSPSFSQSTAPNSPHSPRDHSIGESWDVSSTVDTGHSPPQLWDEDPSSSKSSLPDLGSGKARDWRSDSSEPEYSDDEMIVLPTATPTIKAVLSEPPTSPKSSQGSAESMGYSSPNLEQIGAPSSPNFVMLDNSSMNFHRPATASSESDPRTNSLSSYNSRGTVVRHAGAAPWINTASSEQLSYRSPSFRSSPPWQSVASFRSTSRAPSGSRSRSATSSSRSLRSVSDLQAAIDNGVPIQYPRIRAPSSTSSRAASSVKPERDFTPGPASGRWNPHLSTVSSIWSAEELTNLAAQAETTSDSEMAEPSPPPAAALKSENTRSSVWLVESSNDSDEERLDSLTNLPVRPIFSQSLSSGSKRSNSNRSLQRPGTGSSTILNILPTWAKVYYLREPMGLNSTLSMIDASRPSSTRPGTSNSSNFNFNLMPTPLNIPRPRSPERERPVSPERAANSIPQRRIESDPRDPRAHWVPSPEPEHGEFVNQRYRLHHSWSPHLFPDRRVLQHSNSIWRPPSLDSRNEPFLGRRNVQVYSFCLGFIFPLAWCIAAVLPLPPKPKMGPEMVEYESDSDVEAALEAQCMNLQQRRHDNARWWRNLNRWMISLGVVVIVIIITLAVIGTTTGF
ncbi:hypothetical protein PENANT_c008G01162 [Penicillium antarcticum]|uniref:Serine-rich protein n=1 Tax=Penicillium antarcticum TaxID=416450 RepID=A0A1V6QB86_9EURO|nr:uncharacterized protein N7508_006991 [Penicillium antarcticum]KAJ5302128.1 hypothetical protein N7508_006991 [Penicillium antarcticum]OQD86106.1 hypothetical protein PENANT_c008G01162 [Penicillium antarcticum]